MLQKFQKRLMSKKGFTLIELIVVIAIIVVLIALIAPNAAKLIGTATDTKIKANAKTVYTAAQAYVVEQKASGVTVADGTLSGDTAIAPIKAYLTSDLKGTFTVTITGGTVSAVTYTEGNKSFTYPTGSSISAS